MLRTILFIILLAYFLGISIRTPFGALLGYLWFAFFRPQDWVWIDISQFHLSLVFGCILLIRSFVSSAWPNLRHPISLGILGFLVTGLISQGNATNPDLGWFWLDFFTRLALVSLLLITLVDSERKLYLTILTVASSLGYYTAKAGLASLIGGGVRFSAGLAGAFIDNNGYALAAVMIIPLLFALSAHVPAEWPCRKAIIWGYRIAAPLSAFAVISTFSRAGLLALIAIVFSYAAIERYRLKLMIALLFIVLLMPFMPLPEGYLDRVNTITTYEETEETSAMSRLHFWKVALKMAAENPLGVGMFNFGSTYNKYDFSDGLYGKNRAVHNSHLQVLTENGFAGFAIWVWLFFYSFRTCFRIRRLTARELAGTQSAGFIGSMAMALIVSMVGFLVGGTFISMALNDLTWVTFALVAALDRLCKARLASLEPSPIPPFSEQLKPA